MWQILLSFEILGTLYQRPPLKLIVAAATNKHFTVCRKATVQLLHVLSILAISILEYIWQLICRIVSNNAESQRSMKNSD